MTWVRLLFYGCLKFMNTIFGTREGSRRERKEVGEGMGKKRGERKFLSHVFVDWERKREKNINK